MHVHLRQCAFVRFIKDHYDGCTM